VGVEVTLKVVLQTSMVLLQLVVVMVVIKTKAVVLRQVVLEAVEVKALVGVMEELTDMMVVQTLVEAEALVETAVVAVEEAVETAKPLT
tara:strand:+ start:269 stop:535 length:267 start_codon:yes stop_codon:yes gene_type:complete